MGGIFAQTIVFTAFGVAMSIANDRKNQAVDRFRSLPIARGAVLGGHAVANLLKALLPIVLMSITGFVDRLAHPQQRRSTPPPATLLMVAFSFAMIWVGVLLGSLVATPEGVTGIAFAVLFPITFVASTFVPLATMPEPLRTVAEWNPVTTLVRRAARAVRQPQHAGRSRATRGRSQHPVAYTWIWIVGIVVVVAPRWPSGSTATSTVGRRVDCGCRRSATGHPSPTLRRAGPTRSRRPEGARRWFAALASSIAAARCCPAGHRGRRTQRRHHGR